MIFKIDRELASILILSLCFMLLFAADATMINMQKIIVASIADEKPGFAIEGYAVTGLVYTMFAISLWFGPYMNYALGPKLTMFLSAIGYLFYCSSYAVETEWAIYAGAIITGLAAGTLWPAQGHYMIENSSPKKTARNAAIFWFIYMNSMMVGNVFVYFTFHGKKYIDKSTRTTTIFGLVAINVIALFVFIALPKSRNSHQVKDYGPIKTIKKSLKILSTPKMMWLSLAFCYAGFQQAFWNGIYSPSIGFTMGFGDNAKEMVALSGILMGVGSVVGAFCPIVFSGWIRRYPFARRLIFFVGAVVQILTFFITFINLPNKANFGDTQDVSLIQPPSESLALLGSLLITVGDSCLTTQIYSIIGDFYRDCSAEACALYKFFKGALVAVSFYGCGHLGLHTQVTIMAVMALVGTFGFFMADRDKLPLEQDKAVVAKETTKLPANI